MRYIDADAYKQKLADKDIFFPALYKLELNEMPTADVVPKSEVEGLRNDIDISYEYGKIDAAREIFEEIEKVLNLSKCYGDSGVYFEHDIETEIAELKKKYTEEK